VQEQCFMVDSPQQLMHCRVTTPFKAQTQFKVFGSLPLPGEMVISVTYQHLSGPTFNATFAYTSAQIAGSLGRPLAGRRSTATVPLVAPQTLFEDRTSRLDLRVSKIVNYNRFRLQVNFDADNALNSSPVQASNSTFGSRWGNPTRIIDPRIFEIGGQIDF